MPARAEPMPPPPCQSPCWPRPSAAGRDPGASRRRWRERIEELWRTLLGAEDPIPYDMDFYEAGGDSLMATQLANRLRKVLDATVRGNELMADASTIADQADLVRQRQAERPGGGPAGPT